MRNRYTPCIGVCEFDPRHDVCIGCYRSLREISEWSETPLDERRRIMEEVLPERERRLTL
ncbi:MAG: DUF1289 domain-containing protein [bacterium]|nr:DUF1289 domain-containing protein [bacterium]